MGQLGWPGGGGICRKLQGGKGGRQACVTSPERMAQVQRHLEELQWRDFAQKVGQIDGAVSMAFAGMAARELGRGERERGAKRGPVRWCGVGGVCRKVSVEEQRREGGGGGEPELLTSKDLAALACVSEGSENGPRCRRKARVKICWPDIVTL